MNRDDLRAMLIRHEGIKLMPYLDSVGKLTIGVGRCIADVGITESEAMTMLENDINGVILACSMAFPWWDSLCDSRQAVLADMVFNLGVGGVKEFVKMLAAIAAKDYAEAANQMLLSKWAGQVGARASELADMMRSGDTIH